MSALSTIDPSATAAKAADSSSLANTTAKLGKDQFLQLLVAQLKHQDPTSPMDGSQFAAQLAQFSTVEQLMQMNTTLTAQNSAAAQAMVSQQAGLANSLIGRDVVLTGGKLKVDADGKSRIQVDLAAAARHVRVEVLADDGKTVLASQELDDVPGGAQVLDVALKDVPAGSHAYRVTAADAAGKAVTITANTIGHVDGTVFQSGQVMLRVDGLVVPLTDITEILAAKVTADTANPK